MVVPVLYCSGCCYDEGSQAVYMTALVPIGSTHSPWVSLGVLCKCSRQSCKMPFVLKTCALSFADLRSPSLMCSPVTSYADQIFSMHRDRNSAGFSLDIPLIMLTASILKIFYWPGARYDYSLLIQALTMIVVQLILLKVALDNRPGWRGGADTLPFADTKKSTRPWDFWRWKSQRM
jgi:hypothetical protein